jgi:hypothetical protein
LNFTPHPTATASATKLSSTGNSGSPLVVLLAPSCSDKLRELGVYTMLAARALILRRRAHLRGMALQRPNAGAGFFIAEDPKTRTTSTCPSALYSESENDICVPNS